MFTAALLRNFKKPLFTRIFVTIAAFAWLVAIAVGFHILAGYELRPGPAGVAEKDWPSESRLTHDPLAPTFVMALHPHCPCTLPTVELFNRLTELAPVPPRVYLLVYYPENESEHWADAGFQTGQTYLPKAFIVPDPGGRLAQLFGLETSGSITAYDRDGIKRFQGGLNSGRGRVEESEGSHALFDVLAGRIPLVSTAPTYGCPIIVN